MNGTRQQKFRVLTEKLGLPTGDYSGLVESDPQSNELKIAEMHVQSKPGKGATALERTHLFSCVNVLPFIKSGDVMLLSDAANSPSTGG